MTTITDKRDILHDEAILAYENANHKMLFSMATGTGKSVIAIKLMKKYPGKYLLLTHTIFQHEKQWKDEFIKHNGEELYNQLDRSCYVSIHKYNLADYDGIIFDEAHHLSQKQWEFVKLYLDAGTLDTKHIIVLTATPGRRGSKKQMLTRLTKGNTFDFNIQKASDEGYVNKFHVYVIEHSLDKKDMVIPAGSKAKPFLTTEYSNYIYMTSVINKQKEILDSNPIFEELMKAAKLKTIYERKRANMLNNLPSKTKAIKKFIESNFSKDERMIIFTKSISVAEDIEPFSIHSKSKKQQKQRVDDFNAGLHDRMSSVIILLEGANLINVGTAIVYRPLSERMFFQSLGRLMRIRPDEVARYYVFVTKDTIEEEWLTNSLAEIKPELITRVTIT